MKYQIIQAPDAQKMADAVNHFISQGWVPLGGPCVCNTIPEVKDNGDGTVTNIGAVSQLTQAMIQPPALAQARQAPVIVP